VAKQIEQEDDSSSSFIHNFELPRPATDQHTDEDHADLVSASEAINKLCSEFFATSESFPPPSSEGRQAPRSEELCKELARANAKLQSCSSKVGQVIANDVPSPDTLERVPQNDLEQEFSEALEELESSWDDQDSEDGEPDLQLEQELMCMRLAEEHHQRLLEETCRMKVELQEQRRDAAAARSQLRDLREAGRRQHDELNQVRLEVQAMRTASGKQPVIHELDVALHGAAQMADCHGVQEKLDRTSAEFKSPLDFQTELHTQQVGERISMQPGG